LTRPTGSGSELPSSASDVVACTAISCRGFLRRLRRRAVVPASEGNMPRRVNQCPRLTRWDGSANPAARHAD
jgi:hypothetical protein